MKNFYYWAILTACIWGLVPTLEKLGLARMPPIAGLFLRSTGVIIGVVTLLLLKFKYIKEAIVGANFRTIALFVGAGILASIVGQICFYNALKTGEASRVVPIAGSFPLVSFVIGIIFLSESITIHKIFGVAFVLVGIVLLK